MKGAEFLFLIALLCAVERSKFAVGQGATSSFSIEESDFSCGAGGNLLCSGNATTTAAGFLKLTPDPLGRTQDYSHFFHTVGVALYKEPVQILNLRSKEVASLNISFSFRIESGSGVGSGDGMAFVMFASETWVGASGNNLGAYNSDGSAGVNTLAVEFDTFENYQIDDDNNHVGIDTTNIKSNVAKLAPFRLAEAYRVYAWVDYDSATSRLEVRVNNASEKPEEAFISYTKSLMDIFDEQNVWVGFSGSNGLCTCFNYYTVYDLSLSSSFAMPPAPSPAVQTAPSRESKSSVSTGLIAGVTVGIVLILIGGCLPLCLLRRRQKMRRKLISGPGDGAAAGYEFKLAGISRSMKMYSYNELCAATDNFSDALKLGEGGFGSVYRGSIPGTLTSPELLVAVKKVSSDSRQGEREFVAEVSTIGMLRHRNIVQLLGWCSEGHGKYLLVYEYMQNGSLDRHLFSRRQADHTRESILSWELRYKILEGLAAALNYLHEGWRQQVIHRDVKSSNVMLDDDYNAMLGDFGLARTTDHYKNPDTTGVAGTFGYIAPEASMTGKYTVKSDVFSFGAVCLEIVCGRRVFDGNYPTDELLLVDYVWRKLSEDDLLSVVDNRLENIYDKQEAEVVLLLGLLCSHPKPSERPAMHRVIEILAGRAEMPPIPKSKPEAEYYCYPYQNRKKPLFVSTGGKEASDIGQQNHVISVAFTSSSLNHTLSATRTSHTSGLTSPGGTDSFNQSYPYQETSSLVRS